jgi:carboxyl-terminal processing protease
MLTDKPFLDSRWRTIDYRASFRAWGAMPSWFESGPRSIPPNKERLLTKPVVVLTSARTFSAAEDFVVVFDAMHRGQIIGQPTGGSTGQPLMFKLPGGGSARICTKDDSYPDGKTFEGKGIVPQIIVEPSVADIRSGRDVVLEAASRALIERSAAHSDNR